MIRRADLGQFASHVLYFLLGREINSVESLERRVGSEFDLERGQLKFIRRSEGGGTESYMINYEIIAEGIMPISLTIYPKGDHFLISVESADDLEGYLTLGINTLGNSKQYKEIGASFANIRDELRRLAEI